MVHIILKTNGKCKMHMMYMCNELGVCVEGQYHTNNEQTQSDECIILFNQFPQREYSQLHNADEYW